MLVALGLALLVGTRITAAQEDRAEKAYADRNQALMQMVKKDLLELSGCRSAAACRSALKKALADNDAYLNWARGATVPPRFKEAHTHFVKGATLQQEGGSALLALWRDPPAGQEWFNSRLSAAADLLQQGDSAIAEGDTSAP